MHKLRYKDGCYVASEVDIQGSLGAIADLAVLDPIKKEFYEIEIKISKSDLTKDLLKDKHREYKLGNRYLCITKFYYAVPTKLVDTAKQMIEENNLPYGIIEVISEKDQIKDSFINELGKRNLVYSNYLKIVKRPKKITENKITPLQEQTFFKRMSSEVNIASRKLLLANDKIRLLEDKC